MDPKLGGHSQPIWNCPRYFSTVENKAKRHVWRHFVQFDADVYRGACIIRVPIAMQLSGQYGCLVEIRSMHIELLAIHFSHKHMYVPQDLHTPPKWN